MKRKGLADLSSYIRTTALAGRVGTQDRHGRSRGAINSQIGSSVGVVLEPPGGDCAGGYGDHAA
jgi:hypothetical protein